MKDTATIWFCATLVILPFLVHSPRLHQDPNSERRGTAVRADSLLRQPAGKRELFDRVQEGLTSGKIALFTGDMASQVLVNLRGAESGYYSGIQVRYLLESYMRPRKFGRLTFTTIDESDPNPYATGSVAFYYHGSRELSQVYVSLSRSGDRWVITQINIY